MAARKIDYRIEHPFAVSKDTQIGHQLVDLQIDYRIYNPMLKYSWGMSYSTYDLDINLAWAASTKKDLGLSPGPNSGDVFEPPNKISEVQKWGLSERVGGSYRVKLREQKRDNFLLLKKLSLGPNSGGIIWVSKDTFM